MARTIAAKNKRQALTGQKRVRCSKCGRRKYVSRMKLASHSRFTMLPKYHCKSGVCITKLGNAEEQPSQAGEITQMK